ncbi:MAG: uroporphyrinogen-III C-methyltransferase [Dehalococcoidia bacterium]
MTDHHRGHVWLVGAGPGDPGLLTLAAADALSKADVVLYDALASPATLRHAPASAELRYVGKRAGAHALSQEQIEAELVALALEGKRVVRLKGGDPFVFGRGGEEALALRRAGIAFTVIPGISSAIAAPAYAGIPVTHRGMAASFMAITGSEVADDYDGAIDWNAAARVDTLVILMGMSNLDAIMSRLAAAGRDRSTPVAVVRWGTRADQQVLRATVATVARAAKVAGIGAPSVVVVGGVAALADELAWFEPGPLAGTRVVVTRARAQASDLATRLEALGALVVEAPVIAVRPRADDLTRDERVSSRWDWIVFTSANGVDAFFGILRDSGRDTRSLETTKIAAIGTATAGALASRGVIADFVPSRGTGETLAAEIDGVSGARILLPVSDLTDDRLANALRKRGGLVEQVAVYENVHEPLDAERLRDVLEADAVTFASGSAARNLRSALGERSLPESTKLVSIGPESSRAVRECFGRLDREAAEPSIDALVEAVLEELTWD